MPARSAFQGSRAKFLLEVKEKYAAAVKGGYAKDAVAIIQQQYLNRYPIELPHDQEPSAEHLQSVDDDAVVPDVKAPDPDVIKDEDEYQKQVAAFEERRRLIIFRKAQIQRRLAYQYGLDNDMDPKDSGVQSAHRVLLHKLTGEGMQKPRLKTASNIWRRSHRDEIEAEARKRAGKLTGKDLHKKLAALREKVAKDFYLCLSEQEKESWKKIAKEEHEKALSAFEETVNGPPSESPDDRQRVIQSLSCFVQPILDLICEATGWKATLIAGGPEPADEGRLNIVSFHSGTTKGDVKMNFGRSEQVSYQKYLTPIYHNFLRKCYSVEECCARTLPKADAYEGLQAVLEDNEHDASMYRGGYPASTNSDNEPLPPRPRSRSPSPPPGRTPSPPPARTPSPCPSPIHPPSPLFSPVRNPSPRISPACEVSGKGAVPSASSLAPLPSPPLPAVDVADPPVSPPSTIAHNPLPLPSPAIAVETPEPPRSPLAAVVSPPPTVGSKRSRDKTDEANESAEGVLSPSKRTKANDGTSVQPIRPQPKKKSAAAGLTTISTPHSKPTASTPLPPSATPPPKWFHQCHGLFSNGSSTLDVKPSAVLGGEWNALVASWARFEGKMSYADIGRLPAKKRPDIISEWIKNARSDKWQPKTFNVKLFREHFASWWLSLQPEWRVRDGLVVDDLVEGDWGLLKMSGVNGVLSILAVLFFWGIQVYADENDHAAWTSAVKSVDAVLSHL